MLPVFLPFPPIFPSHHTVCSPHISSSSLSSSSSSSVFFQMTNSTCVHGRHHPLMCGPATKCQECREPGGGGGVKSNVQGVIYCPPMSKLHHSKQTSHYLYVNMRLVDGKNRCCSFASANCPPPPVNYCYY